MRDFRKRGANKPKFGGVTPTAPPPAPAPSPPPPAGLAFAPPTTLNYTSGTADTLDLLQYVSGGTPGYSGYAVDEGTLPTGISIVGDDLIISTGTTAGTYTGIKLGVDDSASSGTLSTNFSVLSTPGGTSLPFSYGHVFKEDDVPSGSYVTSDLSSFQATPTSYWPNGSLRHAIIAGRANCTAEVATQITLTSTTTAPSGTALTQSDLSTALGNLAGATSTDKCSLVVGSETINLVDLVSTSAMHKQLVSGPVMSHWYYRKAITGSNHRVAWFSVRLFAGGAISVVPWIENGYMYVASPGSNTSTYTFKMNNTTRYTGSIEILHHQRKVLIDNSASSHKYHAHWSSDPQIVPQFNRTYLDSTKLTPHYEGTPQESAYTGLVVNITPNSLANYPTDMGAAGTNGALLDEEGALYMLAGDTRAYNSIVANGFATGLFGNHYRDETTNNVPVLTDYPNFSLDSGIPTVPTPTGTAPTTYVITHSPNFGYFAWLLTGEAWFLEAMQFQAVRHYIIPQPAYRPDGLFNTERSWCTARGTAWGLRTLAQCAAFTPTGTIKTAFQTIWATNMAYYEDMYVSGTLDSGLSVNTLGFVNTYESNMEGYNPADTWRWAPSFMQNFLCMSVAYAWDIKPTSDTTAVSNHQAFRNFLYQYPVGMINSFCYRRAASFDVPIMSSKTGKPWTTYPDMLTKYKAYKGLSLDCATGQTLLDHSSDTNLSTSSSSSFASGWWGQFIPALVYAVDHGATGASTAYTLLEGASNYNTMRTDASVANKGVWAIHPRTV